MSARPEGKMSEDNDVQMEFVDELTNKIADHEVWMAFRTDHQACEWRYWWESRGKNDFQKWLDKEKSKRKEQLVRR